jgi:hypothetical protein
LSNRRCIEILGLSLSKSSERVWLWVPLGFDTAGFDKLNPSRCAPSLLSRRFRGKLNDPTERGFCLHLSPVLRYNSNGFKPIDEVIDMTTVTITEILDDLRAADEITRRFERRYWLSSADFYELYSQGLLDDGEHTEDFALWAGFYEIKLDRKKVLIRANK